MDRPRGRCILAAVDTLTAASLEDVVRRADGATGIGRLLQLLGLCGPLSELGAAAQSPLGPGSSDEIARVWAGEPTAGIRVFVIGTRAEPESAAVPRLTRLAAAADPMLPGLLVTAGPGWHFIVLSSCGLDGHVRQLRIDRGEVRAVELEALLDLAAGGERGTALALRVSRALDRSRVTERFFRDFRACRATVGAGWSGIPADATKERGELALLLLCRLMFLYFLQRRGHLAGNQDYLPHLFSDWLSEPRAATFYRSRLELLFFHALNKRVGRRSASARALGELPYLNGGLFDRAAVERRFPDLDLPDDAVRSAFDGLLERYRFTATDAASHVATRSGEASVDPEMLGRVFEGLMSPGRRGATGTFYTPPAVVDRVVRDTLAAYLTERCGLDRARAGRLLRSRPAPGGVRTLRPQPAPGGGRTMRAESAPRAGGVDPTRVARAISEVRVLDPACGSGAFLLGALLRLSRLHLRLAGCSADVDLAAWRRRVVGTSLFGVDVQEDAALLCALRLWLALTEPGSGHAGEAPPLPNLDHRVRQGDALLDPLDLLGGGPAAGPAWTRAALDGGMRGHAREIERLAAEYLEAEPEGRQAVRDRLAGAENRLASAWSEALERRLGYQARELRESANARDLFGEPTEDAPRAAAALREVESQLEELDRVRASLRERGALPFFSFDVHFADASGRGFDVVVSNPPWIRSHSWPAALRRLVRDRYEVCRPQKGTPASVPGRSRVGGQVDVAMLFLERCIRLLARPGALGMLLPAKFIRSLSAGPARALLLRETCIHSLEDHGLDHRRIFRADAFTAVLVAIRRRSGGAGRTGGDTDANRSPLESGSSPGSPSGLPDRAAGSPGPPIGLPDPPIGLPDPPTGSRPGREPLIVTMTRRGARPLRFALDPHELPLVPGANDSPWLLAPPGARAGLRRMQAAGIPIERLPGLRIRRGVMTGANDAMIIHEVKPKLGGLAVIRAEGYFRAERAGRSRGEVQRYGGLVEADALCPLVRGCDLAAWRYRAERHVVWRHDPESARPVPAPPRLAAYLARLNGRSGSDRADERRCPDGVLKRISADTLRPKVAWRDLAETLEAVALPGRVRGITGIDRPLLPLNTVYYIPVTDGFDPLLLAGWLNSLPLRTFARSLAERAKDARFRFFAWTVAALPLPADWADGRVAAGIARMSARAHERGGILPEEQKQIDAAVAGAFGLNGEEAHALERFDAWLRGAG